MIRPKFGLSPLSGFREEVKNKKEEKTKQTHKVSQNPTYGWPKRILTQHKTSKVEKKSAI